MRSPKEIFKEAYMPKCSDETYDLWASTCDWIKPVFQAIETAQREVMEEMFHPGVLVVSGPIGESAEELKEMLRKQSGIMYALGADPAEEGTDRSKVVVMGPGGPALNDAIKKLVEHEMLPLPRPRPLPVLPPGETFEDMAKAQSKIFEQCALPPEAFGSKHDHKRKPSKYGKR